MSGPSDQELAELRKTFDCCDLNGDGFINPDEFHALLIKLDGDVSREECQLDFDVADSEGEVVAVGQPADVSDQIAELYVGGSREGPAGHDWPTDPDALVVTPAGTSLVRAGIVTRTVSPPRGVSIATIPPKRRMYAC